jgi:hypothetical protein
VERELQTTHAATIATHLASGNGVLIVIRMQEWVVPDFNGMRARGLLGVYIEGGPTQAEALRAWNKPKLINQPPEGWRAYEQFIWIDPRQ